MDAERKEKILTLDGEGQVTFKMTDKGLAIEIFQQSSMSETVDFIEMKKLQKWLLYDLIGDV